MTDTLQHYDVVPTHLAIRAMRDSGYKNAAYAIAELIDNSIQAGADNVELLCTESEELVEVRTMRRIDQVAVLDNGSGMDASTLRIALQFGNGTRLDDRTGIGRFGMGLPNSSISQCRRVDVWTWQDGPDSALYSYLDIDEIANGQIREVPDPAFKPIPKFWRQAGESFQVSGTLVVWSELDRCQWRTATAIIRNSEFIVGRMYRYFIHSGDTQIRMAKFLRGQPTPIEPPHFAQVNDPLYLKVPSSCPDPYDKKPMFEKYGKNWEYRHPVVANGTEHFVTVRYATASEGARKGHNPGARPYGKHARRNVGVSILRAGRELELSSSWVTEYDPVERWWGVEIEFSPELDELFGVANNKQSARYLSEAGNIDVTRLCEEEGCSVQELREKLFEEGDPLAPLLDLSHAIDSNLKQIRAHLKAQTKNLRSGGKKRHEDPNSPEARGTSVVKNRQKEGYRGQSDEDENLPETARRKAIEDDLIEQGLPEETARRLATETTNAGLKYLFADADLATPAFFSVKPKGGAIVITMNTSHPAYKHLIEVLETDEVDEMDPEELRERLLNAWHGLKLLLEAWARYEDEQPAGPLRSRAQDTRNDWGKVARQFMEEA